MDEAIRKTNKLLRNLEGRIGDVYKTDPSLLRIQKKYAKYMAQVEKQTEALYEAYIRADSEPEKKQAKEAYGAEVRRLTVDNRQYKAIIDEFARIMAQVNQKALDLVNAEMTEIYTINYNQVAVDCRKVGIEVNG